MAASITCAPISQAAVVTVGAPLPMPVVEGFRIGCGSCVLTNPTAPSGASDVSPVDGVILRWRLFGATAPYSGVPNPSYRLRVLSPLGGDYVGAGTSALAVPSEAGAVATFSAHLPIKAGQLIALELSNGESEIHFGISPAVTSVFLDPGMSDGETASPAPGWGDGWVFPFNADVLPPPVISGVGPAGGSFDATNQVTITGDNFVEVKSVIFGSDPVNFTISSESKLTAVVPPGAPLSSVPVTVVTAAGSTSVPAGYSYEGCVVPKLKGRSLKTVRMVLGRNKCRLGQVRKRHHATVESGRVKRQSPHPGTVLPLGGAVKVAIGLKARTLVRSG